MRYRRRVAVVGIGRVGKELVRSLPADWQIVAIDSSQEKLDAIPERESLELICGDATSRLTLKNARLEDAHSIAIVTRQDAVNREVARMAREDFAMEDVVCLLNELDDLESVHLEKQDVVHRTTSTATLVANRMSVSGMQGIPLGLGAGELLEVKVLDDSPAVGKSMKDLKPRQWLVAAVYRSNELIVPHGDTKIHAGDRLLLVGEPDVVESVAPLLRGGEAVFPGQFGVHLGLIGSEQAGEEAQWLCDNTKADQVETLDANALINELEDTGAIRLRLAELDVGAVVLDAQPISLMARIGLSVSRRKRFVQETGTPVLIARGKHPYKTILVAVGNLTQVSSVGGLAIDLARQVEARLGILTVRPAALSVGEGVASEFQQIYREVSKLARIHGVEVKHIDREGNPIKVIREVAKDFDLLVVGNSQSRRNTIFTPDISLYLMHEVESSVLFVPWSISTR